MMRRATLSVLRRQAMRASAAAAATPSFVKPEFVKVFESSFEAEEYPERAAGGDHVLFSKLMFKLAQKENKADKYLKDLEGMMADDVAGKFGPHWRAEANVGEAKEFQHLEPGLRFVLRWMQTTDQLDKLEDVAVIFKAYVKSAAKTVVVPVTLGGLPQSNAKQSEAARKAAEQIIATRLPEKKGWKLEFEYLVDPGILDGWRVECGSYVVEDMSTYLSSRQAAEDSVHAADYTSGPRETFHATVWDQNPATEFLGEWCDELSRLDAEEAKFGC